MVKEKNVAFIDGQNLYLGTRQDSWVVDLPKFRVYLRDKYGVTEAYYFLGYLQEENEDLYKAIQRAGFIVSFKEHNQYATTQKKGNVDADIIFEAMRNLLDNEDFDKIILVSGDGDHKKMASYLVAKNRLKKILFPNKKFASSLYKKLGSEFYDYLENVKSHIEFKGNEKGS